MAESDAESNADAKVQKRVGQCLRLGISGNLERPIPLQGLKGKCNCEQQGISEVTETCISAESVLVFKEQLEQAAGLRFASALLRKRCYSEVLYFHLSCSCAHETERASV